MTITLAFTIYNKENWVISILESWIENASDKSNLEIIIVFDDLKDNSKVNAKKYLDEAGVKYKFLHANDKHEIFCNNLALEHATGDYIIFIQDDNWIYDKGWDVTIHNIIREQNKVGAIALLAGAKIIPISKKIKIANTIKKLLSLFKVTKSMAFYPRFVVERLETNREHKGDNFSIHHIPSLPLGIWQIHLITRPFCISRKLLLNYGGLNKSFMPHTGDDIDLSLKLLGDGYQNLYVSFDLVNISTIGDNLIHGTNNNNVKKALKLNYKYHKKIINNSHRYSIRKISDIDSNLKLIL